MESSLIYAYTMAYVSHSSAATCVICEPMDVAVASTRYLPHIVLAVKVEMACLCYKFHSCGYHGHSCSFGLFGRPCLNTPCWGAAGCYSATISSVTSVSPSVTAFAQYRLVHSFILHDKDALCYLVRIVSQEQKFRLVP